MDDPMRTFVRIFCGFEDRQVGRGGDGAAERGGDAMEFTRGFDRKPDVGVIPGPSGQGDAQEGNPQQENPHGHSKDGVPIVRPSSYLTISDRHARVKAS